MQRQCRNSYHPCQHKHNVACITIKVPIQMLYRLALFTLMFALCCSAEDFGTQRQPIPEAPKLLLAKQKMREIFKTEIAQATPATLPALALKVALANKLLELVQAGTTDPAEEYILLIEARDWALAGQDLATAFNAIDRMAAHFKCEEFDLKLAALNALPRAVLLPERAATAYGAALAWANRLEALNQFEFMPKLFPILDDLARRQSESGHAVAAEQIKTLRLRQAEGARFMPLLEKMVTTPDDPALNLAAGRFYAAMQGNWDLALQYLAKSGDKKLLAVLEKETLATSAENAPPTTPVSPALLDALENTAEAWAAVADGETGLWKSALQTRAMFWFSKLSPLCTGLRKVKIERRMATLAPSLGGATSGLEVRANLKAWFNSENGVILDRDGRVGIWEDSSGAKIRALPYVPENRPMVVQRTRPALNFDGKAHCLVFPLDINGWSALTAIAVSAPSAELDVGELGNEYAVLNFPEASSWGEMNISVGMKNVGARCGTSQTSSQLVWKRPKPIQSGEITLTMIAHDGSKLTDRLYVNGKMVLEGTDRKEKVTNCIQKAFIGNGLTYHFAGDIYEILIYNSVLTDTERASVEGYLKKKYGLK